MSPTVLVSIPKTKTIVNTTIIAINEEGTAFEILGKSQVINIVRVTSPAIIIIGVPVSHSICPSGAAVLNCSS